MSKNTTFGLHTQGEYFTAVGVSPDGEGKWTVSALETGAVLTGPSANLRAILGTKGTGLGLVTPGKEIQNALTPMPRLKKKELNLAVRGWVGREESTRPEEWRVAWKERKKADKEDERTDVFILYGREEDLTASQTRASQWGGQPTRMLPDYMILDQMYRQHGPKDADLQGWNLVFVTSDVQFLCVATGEGLVLTRELPADLSQGTDLEEHIGRLATEVDRSLFFARQTEYNPRIDRILVCGEDRLATALVAKLAEDTSVPVAHWDIAALFDTELAGSAYLPAMAAVLATSRLPFNLLADAPRNWLPQVVRRRLALAAVTAAWTLVPLLTVGGLVTAKIQDHYLKGAEERLQEALRHAEDAKEIYRAEKLLEDREKHIHAANEGRRDYAGVLLHLAALTPDRIVYKDLQLRDGPSGEPLLRLTGESMSDLVADAQTAFIDFQRALNQSDVLNLLGEPTRLVVTADRESGDLYQKVEFSMECGIGGANTGPDKKPVAVEEMQPVAMGGFSR